MDLSFVIPAYEEEDNVVQLFNEITYVMKHIDDYFEKLGRKGLKYKTYEIIFIDDGSKDKTFENLAKIKDKHLKIIKFRRNFGQSAGFLAGFDNAKGDVIVTMDADLQNDPRDVPKLLVKLEDYDAVSGWRVKRKDKLRVKIQSRISNYLRHKVINDSINDSGCSLKAYKRECLDGLELYGEMHRYIVSLVALKGFKIGEVKVRHRARIHGKTKYKTKKVIKGFLDLGAIWFWQKYSSRPLHLFGSLGIVTVLIGFLSGFWAVLAKIFFKQDLSSSIFTLLFVLLMILGVQFIVFGLIADIQIKSYFKKKNSYVIEKIV